MFSVKIRKSRMWIPALGAVIAFGFLHNCAIAPWVDCRTVSWTELILAFSIVIGLGGTRDVVMKKFQYLELENFNSESKSWLTNKIWIPCIGWFLVLGFLNNIALAPYFEIHEIDWSGLLVALSVMLSVSGARDYGLYNHEHKKRCQCQQCQDTNDE